MSYNLLRRRLRAESLMDFYKDYRNTICDRGVDLESFLALHNGKMNQG